ncbi:MULTISPECIES: ferric-rhodotorulic acid/ferric-coprogen receptor FhuE [unclassified Pantoea]|uniref:ferric-rhodotorulic acid/ferric-coprogen receptor FhuE n=1 Tax=unclassified Pantoea TaxID=2630326 RepID=UPI001CD2D404|nr:MULTISPECIES: ferric-rhodotorulic acid/ferric-coprogen receptor FhuE [unclassified Pantoea]MCA1178019.1 ferric-rhodotorulic acid/ferric-coprogen receptor FhuE [Pantoea sp. alder69]MCA1252720.1 ferric-rhodotorulic acid/ferric-coprogen receptor FhuE [Pantoea sp. alder70]MCA1266217.1 ferric-rhodotorulic acid/ferric-coprogen receptor FhuE [Pantoea sp. alder81]
MSFKEKRVRESGRAPQRALRVSLLAMMVASGIAQAADSTTTEQTLTVDASASSDAQEQAAKDYSVPVTRAGTKMALTARDIPQSVSIVSKQRMQDQQLQSLNDVLSNTTGIRGVSSDMDRTNYYSRGFIIDNYMVDGIPTAFASRWNLGDAQTDMALYERVEVVRGATGLLTGPGNPSASINMVRKHADSKEFTGNLEASYGSWDKQRYVADLSAPLSPEGNVRGRVVAGYEDKNSFIERYGFEKKFIYGVVDADLTDKTKLSVGYEFTQVDTDSPMWSGSPRWNTDGTQTHLRRGYNTSPEWAYNNKENKKVFVNLQQNFDNGWNITLNGTHNEMLLDSKQLYIDGYFDKNTGIGTSPYANYPVVGGTGYNTGKRKVDAVDAFASGPYELLGRQHELMVGVNYSRQDNKYYSAWANISPTELGNFNNFNGNFPETDWNPREPASDTQLVRQKSAYVATRISLADPLHVILGARYTNWNRETLNAEMEKNNTTPYGGVIWDFYDNWSAYASYTSVFQPQDYQDATGGYLSPVIGKNYEAGVKSDWLNSRLTTSISVFRSELDNVAEATGATNPDTGNAIYVGKSGVVSRGVEFEVNGALTDNWQMTFGGTTYVAEDRDGENYNSQLPRTSFNLFTSYRLPMLDQLTLGGGVNWQSKTYKDVGAPDGNGTWRARQGSYALVDLFARYDVTKNLSVQGNLNNLFDKEYDENVGSGGIVYGEPRSFSVTASYRF